MFTEVSKRRYTYVFTSPEIVISKKFKKCIFNHFSFTGCFYLLVVDEIHLVEEWGKNFCLMYVKNEKIWKRIPCHVFLLGVSAMLTKSISSQVVEKAGFLPNYQLLLQTFLNQPEIMQLYCFMEHPKSSCLDLQFVLPPKAKITKNIQKTIIFINSVNEIQVIISIFYA